MTALTEQQNTEMLAQWMNAKFFISTYRPIPIDEYLVYENGIYPAATSRQLFQTASKLTTAVTLHDTIPPHRIVEPSIFKQLSNSATNSMVALAVETATAGFGSLIFCGSRNACQVHAATIGEAMPPAEPEELNKRLDLLAELRSLSCGLDPALETTIVKGVGFHSEYSGFYIINKPTNQRLRCRNDHRRAGTHCTSL
jgi:replicative superfamily II helicase